ncbi:MAG TPA: hypothetical protein VL400_07575, partial [Polyangiaceae bacterium]|nr:hypothetical protein [Polyangiaceae bacterium]
DPASLPPPAPGAAPFAATLAELGAIEEEYRRTLAAHVHIPAGIGIDARGLLDVSSELGHLGKMAADVDDVQAFASQGLGNALEAQARILSTVPVALREAAQGLHERYVGAIERGLTSLARRIASEQAAGAKRIAAAVAGTETSALPAIALGAVLGTEGVALAIVTARTPSHAPTPRVVAAPHAFERARAKP